MTPEAAPDTDSRRGTGRMTVARPNLEAARGRVALSTGSRCSTVGIGMMVPWPRPQVVRGSDKSPVAAAAAVVVVVVVSRNSTVYGMVDP